MFFFFFNNTRTKKYITSIGNLDDETPTLNTSTSPLELDEGTVISLMNQLSFTDADTADATLSYSVSTTPSHGFLSSTSFTQADIDAGSVTYTSSGVGEFTSDTFAFNVTDGTQTAGPFNFYFNLTLIDDET